jgi:hypothetical protein
LSGFEISGKLSERCATRAEGRRNLLCGFLGLLGVLSIDGTVGVKESCSAAGHLEKWLRHFGAHFLGDCAALGRLGEIYLTAQPKERNRKELLRLISGVGVGSIRGSLIESIARDWSEHNVVVVDGWVLARTEARICALLHHMDGARV